MCVAALFITDATFLKFDTSSHRRLQQHIYRRFLLICGCVAMFLSWLGASLCVYSGGLEDGKAELYFPSYVLRFFFGSFLCLFAFSYTLRWLLVGWLGWLLG